jgi:hypothetical protein
MKTLLLFLMTLMICCSGCTDDELWGSGISDDDGDNGGGTEPPPGGGEPSEFELFGVNVFTAALFTIDPDNGSLDLIGPLNPDTTTFSAPTAMAVRASDDAIFVWNNANGTTITGVLLRVDRCTGLGVPVDSTETPQGQLNAIAFQGSRLWAVGPAEGSSSGYALYEVITSTGIKLLRGGTLPNIAGLAADQFRTLHGLQQVADGNNPLGLYILDTITAEGSRIADIDDRLVSGASLAFDGDVLLGTGQHRNGDPLIFEIDPLDGDISNILILEQVAQGIGISASCNPTDETFQGDRRQNGGGPGN